MTIEEEIIILENKLQEHKNNYEIAVKKNNPVRQTKYANIMIEVKEQIKQFERKIPIESNERLRKIIEEQNKKIAIQQEVRSKQGEKLEELEARIEAFIKPKT